MKFFLNPSHSHKGLHRTHVELHDGSPFTVTHTATPAAARAIEDGQSHGVQEIIMANGSFTGRAVLAPLVENMIDLAHRAGRKLEITTYDDPLTGQSAFRQDARTERFRHVIDHVRTGRRLGEDYPLSLAGQSRGWLSVVGAAIEGCKAERFGRLTGLAPVGHTPHHIEINRHDVTAVLGMTWGELTDEHANQKDRYALKAKLGIARNAVVHTVGNSIAAHDLRPGHAVRNATLPLFREVHEILTTDITDEVVALSNLPGTDVTLFACRHDRYAPGEAIIERFAAIPEFAGQTVLADEAHNSVLLDRHLVPDLYGIITGQPVLAAELQNGALPLRPMLTAE